MENYNDILKIKDLILLNLKIINDLALVLKKHSLHKWLTCEVLEYKTLKNGETLKVYSKCFDCIEYSNLIAQKRILEYLLNKIFK